ncbi:MAG: GAF domain-containing protein [Vicinamibacterales bacterium]
MKRRTTRLIVVLVFAAIAGAAIHQTLTRYKSIDAARDRVTAIDVAARQADLALMEIAASERGYVAPGQGLDFWAARVDESIAAARAALAGIQSSATNAAAAAEAGSAISRLDDFVPMDARAREYTRNGQRAMASDLIFADGYEMIAAARTDAAGAAAAVRAAVSAPLTRDRQIHLASLAALGACMAVALLLLLRGPKQEPALPERSAAISDDSIDAALDASLERLDDFAPASAAPPASPATPASTVASVDLAQAADVCVDLARLLDARDLQAVLARVAEVVNADGLIVWMIDPAGNAIAPALSHGYSPAIMARVGPLALEADNATAAAWRSKSVQVVGADGTHPGALAVPLLTRAGCMGVLAVELRNGRERASDVQSLARIVAAQLAASISPADAETRRAAEA